MFKKLILALVVCLFFAAIVRAQDDDDEEAQALPATTLIVYKNLKEYEAIVNNNITIAITVYNVGESAAYNVQIKDNDWPEGSVETLEGENKASVDVIEAGSNFTFSYTIVPRATGDILTIPAVVSFSPVQDDDSNRKFSRSNPIPKIPVLTQSEYDKKHDGHVDDVLIFLLLLTLPIGVPAVMYLYADNQIAALAADKKKLKTK
ncbi:translocon-associated protein subunit beta [Acrasis kona]|uniref:Translocon-associated protein subunit beta n=1 Tax=Acrasis kona TaxID=1008807 RepID=A0AAW2ZLE3_9EUKA